MYCFFAYRMWTEATASRPTLRMFAVASLIVGITSGLYHASYTWFFQLFDFVGMFCFCMISVTLNARRLDQLSFRQQNKFYAIGVVLCTLVFLVIPFIGLPVQSIVAILIIVTIGQEFYLHNYIYKKHTHMRPKMKSFYQAFLLLFIAFGCSIADLTRVWCDPTNHWMNGHSMWHVLTSIVLYLLFKFHSQFAYESNQSKGLLPIKIQTV